MKGVRSSFSDWNIRVLFLRSKSSPRLYFLNRWGHRGLQSTDGPIPFDSVKLANDLLRIDLGSFFTEMASWHLYYRKNRPTYTLADRDNRFLRPQNLDKYKSVVFHKRALYWKRLQSTPYVDLVEGFEFKPLSFSNYEEYACWSAKLPPISPDFKTAVNRALDRSSKGVISDTTKDLLLDACSICLKSKSLEVPDPLYYSYLFGNIAAECTEISEFFSAICSDKKLIERYNATDLFDSYLNLGEHNEERTGKSVCLELVEEPAVSTYNPRSTFKKFFSRESSPWLESHDLDYLQSLYAVALQACAGIHAPTCADENTALLDLEAQLIKAYIDTSNTELREIAEDLDRVINQCAGLPHRLRTQYSSNRNANTLADILDELKKLKGSDYLHSLAQLPEEPFQGLTKDASDEEIARCKDERHRYRQLRSAGAGMFNKSLVQGAKPSDRGAFLEQIKRQAIIRFAKNTCLLEREWSFSKFYARLLSELIECGKVPIKCKACGSLFFPTSQSNKYCDRFDTSTNLYCNPRLNEKHKLGRKAPHGTAVNLHKKAETALQLNEKRRRAYFAELEEFVDHEIGPIYFKSTLIPDELYDAWKTAINIPKNQPKAKMPEHLGFPHPVIWENQVIEGNQMISVYLNQHAHPELRKKLDQHAKSSKSQCTALALPHIPHGCWILSLFELIQLAASINRAKTAKPEDAVPVPGLGQMASFIPERNPLKDINSREARILRFPSSGKESSILFELLDPDEFPDEGIAHLQRVSSEYLSTVPRYAGTV